MRGGHRYTKDRQAQTSVGRLRMQGREQLDRKASILKAPHPGMQTFIHLFIPQIIIQYPLYANQCQAQQTQQKTKWTNIPAFMEFIC